MEEIRVSQVAELVGGELKGEDFPIAGVCSVENPKEDHLTFLEKGKELKFEGRLAHLTSREEGFGRLITRVLVSDPREAFLRVLLAFFDPREKVRRMGEENREKFMKLSFVHPRAKVSPSAVLFPFVYVDEDAVIEDDAILFPGVVVMRGVVVKRGAVVGPGTILGYDGFGYYKKGEEILRFPQVGGLVVGEGVELGANCCVDRGAIDDTLLGERVVTDNLVQIGHNVRIGARTVIAAQCGFAGRVKVGEDCVFGGQVGFRDGVVVGDGVAVGGKSGVFTDLKGGRVYSGYPAVEHSLNMKILALLRKLPEMWRRLNLLWRERKDER